VAAEQELPRLDLATGFKCVEDWSEVMHFGSVGFPDFVCRIHAFCGKRSPELDGILLAMANDLYQDYLDSKVQDLQIVMLIFTLVPELDPRPDFFRFGVDGLKGLRPSVKAPLAYVFGHRYKTRDPTRSRGYFQLARDSASQGSLLQELAIKDLQGMSKDK
jgi:hypothetical protein